MLNNSLIAKSSRQSIIELITRQLLYKKETRAIDLQNRVTGNLFTEFVSKNIYLLTRVQGNLLIELNSRQFMYTVEFKQLNY